MAQDCEKVFSDTSMGILYTFHGENTLVSDLWNLSEGKQKFKNFKEMFND